MSRIIDLGKVMVSLSGEWQRDASYEYLTAVEHKGSGYISKVDNIGVEPGTDENVWMRFAKAGESPEVTKDAKGNIYVNGELLTTAFADAEAAAIRIAETNTSIRAAEQARVNAENARVTAERLRTEAEGLRQQAENGRKSSESARVTAENARVSAENARSTAEATRQQNENARTIAEGERRNWYGEAKRKIDSFDDSNIRRINEELSQLKQGVRVDGTAVSLAGAAPASGENSVSECFRKVDDPPVSYFSFSMSEITLNESQFTVKCGMDLLISLEVGAYYKLNIREYSDWLPGGVNFWLKLMDLIKYVGAEPVPSSGIISQYYYTFEFVSGITYETLDEGFSVAGEFIPLRRGPLAKYSHAEGLETMTLNEGEHAEGKWNKSTPGVTMFSIGCGTGAANRKNAVEVDKDGKVFILGVGGYDGTNPDEADDLATVLSE